MHKNYDSDGLQVVHLHLTTGHLLDPVRKFTTCNEYFSKVIPF